MKAGAKGVGELSDKGFGLRYAKGFGPHINDPHHEAIAETLRRIKDSNQYPCGGTHMDVPADGFNQ